MKRFGLTGGIGSGKSAAARAFEKHGIPAIDADRIGHEVIAPGGAAEERVRNVFGPEILTCGKVDRDKLAAVVFESPEARTRLNETTHPAIFAEIAERCHAFAEQGCGAVIIEAALIAEKGETEPWLDGLILVACPREERRRRLTEQRGMDAAEVQRRIDAQTPPEKKRPLARWIIDNSGSRQALEEQVARIAGEIKGAVS
jgi:dephospho-CoA kinase